MRDRPFMADYRVLWALERAGFDVVNDAGQPPVVASRYADSVVAQIQRLTAAGVPPRNIAVLADYRNAGAALLVSARIPAREVRYIFIAGCTKSMAVPKPRLHGKLLSIVDRTDSLDISCKSILKRSEDVDTSSELVLDTGLGHRAFFQQLDAWMEPAVKWAVFAR